LVFSSQNESDHGRWLQYIRAAVIYMNKHCVAACHAIWMTKESHAFGGSNERRNGFGLPLEQTLFSHPEVDSRCLRIEEHGIFFLVDNCKLINYGALQKLLLAHNLRDEMICLTYGTLFWFRWRGNGPRFAIGGGHVLSITMSHDQNDRHCLTKQA
jgi:hypothetical protein